MVVFNVTTTDVLRIADRTTKTVTKPLLDPLRIQDRVTRTITKIFADILRVRDYLANRTITKSLRENVRIIEVPLSKATTLILATEALKIVERTVTPLQTVLRYLGLNLGRFGIRIRQVRDEANTEV